MPSAASEHLKDHIIVRAGAGAGKTHRLTHHVLDTAMQFKATHERFPRMIVTTFTRKATQELRERLMVTALREKPEMIDFVNSRSHLVVSTIHGVLDIYLKRYGGNIHIDPGYTVMASGEADRLSRNILRQLLVANPDWQALLETYGFDRLVTLVRKLNDVYLKDDDAKAHSKETLAGLFRDYAAELSKELRNTGESILAEAEKDAWRSMGERFLRFSDELERDWEKVRGPMLEEIATLKAPPFTKANPPVEEATGEKTKDVLKTLRELEAPYFDPNDWEEFGRTYQTFEQLGRAFSKALFDAKIREGGIELSDLELLAMKCLRANPETIKSFAEEWDYWLIDEYQDTSPFQVELLRLLSSGRPNFIVGDPQQSIYLFRGARSEVFREKEEEILSGGGTQDFLKTNYRSRPELLLFFNDLFSRLEIPFRPMEPRFKDGQTLDPSISVARFVTINETVDEEKAASSDRELLAIVRHVQDLLAKGAAPEDICVLARTNQTLLDVAAYLAKYYLPTHIHAASGFYSRRETLDALALLRFLLNPYDNFNTIQLLRSPWFRVPDDVLVSATIEKGENSHWERICQTGETNKELEAISRLKMWLAHRLELGITETFKLALTESGFIDLAHFHDHSGRRESNVWKLVSQLSKEEARPGFNYLDFISQSERDLREASGAEESDAIAAVEPDRINLMTIHSSKGLQFKHVILPRMGQKPRFTTFEDFTYDESRKLWALRIPRGETMDMTASLAEKVWLEKFRVQEKEEHARVLYVALTRAVDSVFMSWVGQPGTDSWASMLRWNLTEGEHQNDSYKYLVESTPPPPDNAALVAQAAVEPRGLWRALGVDGDSPVQHTTSVTQLLEQTMHRRKSIEALAIPARLQLASQGTAVHRLMEALKSPSRDGVRNLIKKWFPEKSEKVTAAVDFVTSVTEPPLADIIRQGCVEWGFAYLHKGTMVEGQIDLWGRIGTTVWVADYKTGSPKAKEKAFQQLALYALALRKGGEVKPGDTVRLAAVYPFAKEIHLSEEPEITYYDHLFS